MNGREILLQWAHRAGGQTAIVSSPCRGTNGLTAKDGKELENLISTSPALNKVPSGPDEEKAYQRQKSYFLPMEPLGETSVAMLGPKKALLDRSKQVLTGKKLPEGENHIACQSQKPHVYSQAPILSALWNYWCQLSLEG